MNSPSTELGAVAVAMFLAPAFLDFLGVSTIFLGCSQDFVTQAELWLIWHPLLKTSQFLWLRNIFTVFKVCLLLYF